LAKATFFTENGKSEKRLGFWCQVECLVGRSRYAAEKHQQFSFYPCGSGFPTAKNRGKMALTQYLETNPSA
jgi:hypothetical protein